MAFNSPNKGDRIEIPQNPGDYFLVTEKPTSGRDASGLDFWQVMTTDPLEQPRMLSSDQVKKWNHFKGPNYDWHDEMVKQRKWRKVQEQQSSLVEDFEKRFRFADGTPLRTNPARPMALRVSPDATGELDLFSGTNLFVKEIDYENESVALEPMDPELALDEMIMETARAIPAQEVVSNCSPTMRGRTGNEMARIPIKDESGEDTGKFRVVTNENLLRMTPELNKLVPRGQVSLSANVYMNYRTADDKTGEEVFHKILLDRGVDPGTVDYYKNPAERKGLADGSFSPRYAWTGQVEIAPPISDEAIDEAEKIATKSNVNVTREGGLRVYSNSLFRNMVSLGVMDVTGPEMEMPVTARWISRNIFAKDRSCPSKDSKCNYNRDNKANKNNPPKRI